MKTDFVFLVDLDHTLYNTEEEVLYEDSLSFIDFLKKQGEVILLTEGEIGTQRAKIEKFDLTKLFGDKIKVFEGFTKISNYDGTHDNKEVVLIDDNPRVLDEAKQKEWKTIRIFRGRHKVESTRLKPDYEVQDLDSIKNLVLFKK